MEGSTPNQSWPVISRLNTLRLLNPCLDSEPVYRSSIAGIAGQKRKLEEDEEYEYEEDDEEEGEDESEEVEEGGEEEGGEEEGGEEEGGEEEGGEEEGNESEEGEEEGESEEESEEEYDSDVIGNEDPEDEREMEETINRMMGSEAFGTPYDVISRIKPEEEEDIMKEIARIDRVLEEEYQEKQRFIDEWEKSMDEDREKNFKPLKF